MIARKLCEQVPPDRTAPVEFQMTEPVRGLHQRRTFAHGGVRYAHIIISGAKMDLLFHVNALQANKETCGAFYPSCEGEARFRLEIPPNST